MHHHLGLAVAGAAACAALFGGCNLPGGDSAATNKPLTASDARQAPPAKPDFDGAGIIADQARRYLSGLYGTDPARVRVALAGHSGTVGVTEGQVQSALADNRAKAPVKDVVIVRQEVEAVPPLGQAGSVWYAVLRDDGTTQTGRLTGWRLHADNWYFTPVGY